MTENITRIAIGREAIGVGSVVQLRSGGPNMTVTECQDGKATCIWHSEDGDVYRDTFPIPCLVVR